MVGRVLAASVALHLAVGVALARLRPPRPTGAQGPIELTVLSPRAQEPRAQEPRAQEPPPAQEPRAQEPPPAQELPRERPLRARLASAAAPPRAAPIAAEPSTPAASPLASTPAASPLASPSAALPPAASPPVAPVAAPPAPSSAAVQEPPAHGAVNLFAASALARAADITMAPGAANRAWRPRHGVGGDGASGGVDIGSFLAEDAARLRVQKGAVAPELRSAERRLDSFFSPTFGQSDVSNRAELFLKQFRGFLRDPPKTGALQRGLDPTKETLDEMARSRDSDRAFFLGRRAEVFVRQRADGSIIEMALRNPSGYRAFDDAALAAVEKALASRVPGVAHGGEVRTLWQLDATAYVVVSPNPELVFDESSGKREWRYPLQKRVDHHVRLLAVY